MIDALSVEGATVIIPTPALAKVLTEAPTVAQAYLEQIQRCACFQIRPFDDKAAIELAHLLGTPQQTELLKFDRQIVAIAKVYGATTLYADEPEVVEFAIACGLRAIRFTDLAISTR